MGSRQVRKTIQAKNISEIEIFTAIGQAKADMSAWTYNPSKGERCGPARFLMQYPEKVVYAKMQKMIDKGLLELGVSIRSSYLTDAGREQYQAQKNANQ